MALPNLTKTVHHNQAHASGEPMIKEPYLHFNLPSFPSRMYDVVSPLISRPMHHICICYCTVQP